MWFLIKILILKIEKPEKKIALKISSFHIKTQYITDIYTYFMRYIYIRRQSKNQGEF